VALLVLLSIHPFHRTLAGPPGTQVHRRAPFGTRLHDPCFFRGFRLQGCSPGLRKMMPFVLFTADSQDLRRHRVAGACSFWASPPPPPTRPAFFQRLLTAWTQLPASFRPPSRLGRNKGRHYRDFFHVFGLGVPDTAFRLSTGACFLGTRLPDPRFSEASGSRVAHQASGR